MKGAARQPIPESGPVTADGLWRVAPDTIAQLCDADQMHYAHLAGLRDHYTIEDMLRGYQHWARHPFFGQFVR